jgi:hypothetical protein
MDILLKGIQNMKYNMILLSMFFTPYAVSMNTRSINIQNKTNQIVLIAYREPACAVVEKVPPHQSLMLSSTTPFLAIMNNQGKIERFPIQHRHHDFVIAAAKSKYKSGLKIFEYNDQYVAKSKNDYFDDGHSMFQ